MKPLIQLAITVVGVVIVTAALIGGASVVGYSAPQEEKAVLDFALIDFDQQTMKKMATLVVLGKVVKQSQGNSDGRVPLINNLVQIEQVLKGAYPGNTVNVVTPGTLNGKVMVEDSYQLKNSERDIFMLFKWKNEYNIVGMHQGKYSVSGDKVKGKFVNGLTVEQFKQKVLGGLQKDNNKPTLQSKNQIQEQNIPQENLTKQKLQQQEQKQERDKMIQLQRQELQDKIQEQQRQQQQQQEQRKIDSENKTKSQIEERIQTQLENGTR